MLTTATSSASEATLATATEANGKAELTQLVLSTYEKHNAQAFTEAKAELTQLVLSTYEKHNAQALLHATLF